MDGIDMILVMGIFFLALFTQSLSGFGLALVSMPLLVPLVGIQTAAPLVAFISLIGEIILLIYLREDLNLGVVWRLSLASVIGIPVGLLLLRAAPERLVLAILGTVVTGFALYALLNFKLPRLEHPLWGYIAGFLAGILGGAYNTAGPPIILYGNCRRWPRDTFKSNLQGFFLVNSIVILIAHFLARGYTAEVWRIVPFAIVAAVLGIFAGLRLDKRLNPQTFRKIVLVLLLVLGIRLLIP